MITVVGCVKEPEDLTWESFAFHNSVPDELIFPMQTAFKMSLGHLKSKDNKPEVKSRFMKEIFTQTGSVKSDNIKKLTMGLLMKRLRY